MTVSCRNSNLLGRVGAGGGALRGRSEVISAEGQISARTLEGIQCHAVSELCNSNDGRVILIDEFPEP